MNRDLSVILAMLGCIYVTMDQLDSLRKLTVRVR